MTSPIFYVADDGSTILNSFFLGFPFLAHHRAILDFPNRTCYLREAAKAPALSDYLCFRFRQSAAGLEITELDPSIHWYAQGLAVGDLIVTIDDSPPLPDRRALIAQLLDWKTLVVLRNGAEKNVSRTGSSYGKYRVNQN